MTRARDTSRCKAQTKAGKPCRAAAMGGGLCFFPANPNKASELGRIGGRKNRHTFPNEEPLPALKTATAVREMVDRLISGVYSGTVDAKIASGLAPLLTIQLRAIGTADLERSVAELQKQLADVIVRQNNAMQPKPSGNTTIGEESKPEKALKYVASTMA